MQQNILILHIFQQNQLLQSWDLTTENFQNVLSSFTKPYILMTTHSLMRSNFYTD